MNLITAFLRGVFVRASVAQDHCVALRAEVARREAELAQRDAEIVRKNAEMIRKDAEIARQRAENRALLNSILGIAGIPPVLVEGAAETTQNQTAGPPATSSDRVRRGEPNGALDSTQDDGSVYGGQVPNVPVRRRSWHQVNRALEIAAARKKEPTYRDDESSARESERSTVIVPRIAP